MKPFIIFSNKEVWKEMDWEPHPNDVPRDAFLFNQRFNGWWRIGAGRMWSQVHPEDVPGEYKVWLMLL